MDRQFTCEYVDSPLTNDLAMALENIESDDVSTIILFACSGNNTEFDSFSQLLANCNYPIVGGIFPGIIFENQVKQSGYLIVKSCKKLNFTLFSDIENPGVNLVSEIQKSYAEFKTDKSFMMLVDSMSGRSEEFIELFYDIYGQGISVIGGGAGSLTLADLPCIFDNNGFHKNAVALITMPANMRTSTGHGWQIAQGPFLVTHAEKNNLISLNYEPALSTYQDVIANVSDEELNHANFNQVAKKFPIGIRAIDGEFIIRDPIHTNNNSLVCIGALPTNAMVYVLKSSPESLIDAARNAAIKAYELQESNGNSHQVNVIFDCISRFLYLEDDFQNELAALDQDSKKETVTFGLLSLGEIANLKSGVLGFLNKSIVVGSM